MKQDDVEATPVITAKDDGIQVMTYRGTTQAFALSCVNSLKRERRAASE